MTDYGLVVPFVAVKSRGGPFDDDSYAAGWEMASLHAHLLNGQPDQHEQSLLRSNREQADLVAMHTGYTVKFEEVPEAPPWLHATFTLEPHAAAVRDERRMAGMSVKVNKGSEDVTHADAVSVKVVDGHLLCLNQAGDTAAVYAPGRWHEATVERENATAQQ